MGRMASWRRKRRHANGFTVQCSSGGGRNKGQSQKGRDCQRQGGGLDILTIGTQKTSGRIDAS